MATGTDLPAGVAGSTCTCTVQDCRMRGQLDLDLLDLHACARTVLTVPVDLDVVYIDHLVATRTTLCSYASFAWGAIFLKKKNFPPRTAHMDRKSSLRGVQNRAICKNLRSGSKDIWVLVSSMLLLAFASIALTR